MLDQTIISLSRSVYFTRNEIYSDLLNFFLLFFFSLSFTRWLSHFVSHLDFLFMMGES